MEDLDLFLQIDDAEHMMWYEAERNTKIIEDEVEEALFNRGFFPVYIEIVFDKEKQLWRAFGNLQKIGELKVGDYSITQLGIDSFKAIWENEGRVDRKIVSAKELEAALSSIFL